MEVVYKTPALGSKTKNRAGEPVEELTREVTKDRLSKTITYDEVYYLDNAVDPSTGEVLNHTEPHYTSEQVQQNYASLLKAIYLTQY